MANVICAAPVDLRTVCQPVGLLRRSRTGCPSAGVSVARTVLAVALVGHPCSTTTG